MRRYFLLYTAASLDLHGRGVATRAWRLALRALCFAAALLPLVALWLSYPHAFVPSDESEYAFYAQALRTFELFRARPHDIFAQRVGVLLPVALSYAIAGVSPRSTDFASLCAAIAIFAMIWLSLDKWRARVIAAVCLSTLVPILSASSDLMPDLPATAGMTGSVFLLARRRELLRLGRLARLAVPCAAALCAFYAFMCKESAYWLLPVWLWAFVQDVRERERASLRGFFVPAGGCAALLLGAYLYAAHALYGSALARVHTLQELSSVHLWAWHERQPLFARVSSELVEFLWQEYGPILVTGVLGALLLPERLRIWGVYGLSCLLLFAFGTTSWRSYQPLPLASRMALPCVPGLVLCSAYFLSELRLVAVSSRWRADALLLALLVLMRVEPLVKFVASWTPNLEAQAIKHVRRQLRAAGGRKLLVVTADQRSAKYLLAYFGFHEPAQAHFVYAGNLTEAMASAVDGAVLFSNSGLSAYLQRAYGARPYEPEFAAGHVMPIYDTHGFTVRVLDKPALLELTKRVVSP